MVITKYDPRLILCMSQLLRNREHAYQCESQEEVTPMIEAVSERLKERELPFTFSVEDIEIHFELID